MSSTPQDQSGTCRRGRSSFFSAALVYTTSTTGGRATFFSKGGVAGRRVCVGAGGCTARTRENEGEDDDGVCVSVCVRACIDCLRCGIIAIRGCKQAGGSVSVMLSARATLHVVTTPTHQPAACAADVLRRSAAAPLAWQIAIFFFFVLWV